MFLLFHFNSIKVRLELGSLVCQLVLWFDFNSIKVRLEPFASALLNPTSIAFQFHKGTIRTRNHQ